MRPAFITIAVAFLVCGFTIALASPTPEEQLEKEFTGRDLVCGYDVNYPTTISSPNYPGPYDSYSGLCRWKITTPDDNVQLIQITVRVLDTPAPSWVGCDAKTDDILVLLGVPGQESHTLSARFCGSRRPARPIYHLGSTVYVLFIINSMNPNYSGFTLDVEFLSAGIDTNLLTMPGVTCSASSIESSYFVCENAYDGVTEAGYGNEWASNREGDGAWLEVTFPVTVQVQSVEIWQRCYAEDQYSIFQLTFSDGSTQAITTPCNGSSSDYEDCTGVPSEYRQLTPVLTSSVRITGYGDCDLPIGNGGIREMKING